MLSYSSADTYIYKFCFFTGPLQGSAGSDCVRSIREDQTEKVVGGFITRAGLTITELFGYVSASRKVIGLINACPLLSTTLASIYTGVPSVGMELALALIRILLP